MFRRSGCMHIDVPVLAVRAIASPRKKSCWILAKQSWASLMPGRFPAILTSWYSSPSTMNNASRLTKKMCCKNNVVRLLRLGHKASVLHPLGSTVQKEVSCHAVRTLWRRTCGKELRAPAKSSSPSSPATGGYHLVGVSSSSSQAFNRTGLWAFTAFPKIYYTRF